MKRFLDEEAEEETDESYVEETEDASMVDSDEEEEEEEEDEDEYEDDSDELGDEEEEEEVEFEGDELLSMNLQEQQRLERKRQQQLVALVAGRKLADKQDDLHYDLGTLLAADQHPFDIPNYKKQQKQEIDNEARENAQLLLNQIFNLPLERLVGNAGAIVKLPKTTTPFPRHKPVPAPKVRTKWEKFAAIKGIQKQKRSKKVWDEASQSYKRRYGYKKANDELADWAIMAKSTDKAGMGDPWSARRREKKERVMKGAVQQMKNMENTQKYLIQTGQKSTLANIKKDKQTKQALERALVSSKKATASVGKFQKRLSHEPKERHQHKKRDPVVGSAGKEKERNQKVAERIFNKKSILDVDKAVSVNKLQKEKQRRLARETGGGGGGGEEEGGEGEGEEVKKRPRGWVVFFFGFFVVVLFWFCFCFVFFVLFVCFFVFVLFFGMEEKGKREKRKKNNNEKKIPTSLEPSFLL